MKKIIANIKAEAKNLTGLSNEELTFKVNQLKKRKSNQSFDEIIPEWYALVQEISFRTIGLKHFDTQLVAGVLLHNGKIVEMKTGEGKTLVSTLPVSLNALDKKGVHVITVNDYLAERDQKWMGKVYEGLGLTTGLVKTTSKLADKKTSYKSDITYLTNSELVFDYLRDCSTYNLNEIVQRPFNFCLIDEIDSILIDESRTPLILSQSKGKKDSNKLIIAKNLADVLEKDIHFQIDEKRKDINITEEGYEEAKIKLSKKSLYESDDPWILEILNALKAKYVFKLNKDYIILNNKVVIVDEFTGRIMEDRRWSMGIHEAIEIKENVEIGNETKTKTSITYQNFFTLYPKLSGMTGTAKTAEIEFQEIYELDVVVLPTIKPTLRKDLPDLVYQNELAKWKAVLNKSKECFSKGQPILIGTTTIEKSEFLSDLFNISNIPHQVLNAKPENVKRENEIVAQAGKRNAITIATNMAGRGTDIILGGNPIFEIKEILWKILIDKEKPSNYSKFIIPILNSYKENIEDLKEDIQNLPYSLGNKNKELKIFYDSIYKEIYHNWEKENELIKTLGGLFVLGTERHETRRIDNQLRGRAGRQGDPGSSQFFVSLEDDLIKVFGGDNIKRWVEYLIEDKEMPLESDLLTKSLENAQKKVEMYNYDLRKNVFQYDDIINSQRKKIFKARNKIVSKNEYEELFLRYTEASFDEIEEFGKKYIAYDRNIEKIMSYYSIYNIKKNDYKDIWILLDLEFAHLDAYQKGLLKSSKGMTLLSIIDQAWAEHIERMNYIRETINWKSYGQQNPLIEYNIEAFNSFQIMFQQIRSYMLYYYMNEPTF
jgi:preprotein translocase subunit SecA